MIKFSEVCKLLESIKQSFQRGFPQNTTAEIESLHKRLKEEITGLCTEVDYTLVELRSNLKEYLKQKFVDQSLAIKFFKEKIIIKFMEDLKQTEIPRYVELVKRLERLL